MPTKKRRKSAWEKQIIEEFTQSRFLLGDPGDDHFIMWLAISQNRKSEVASLLNYVSPNSTHDLNDDGCTFLHAAAGSGRVEIIQLLLNAGADANTVGKHGVPLVYAARNGHEEAYKLLKKMTSRRHHWLASRLVRDSRYRCEESDALFELSRAAWECREKGVRRLIGQGVDPNAGCLSTHGATSLHFAARGGDKSIVRFLLKQGCNPNAPNYDRQTPLFFAAEVGVCKLLLDAGADPHALDVNKTNAIMRAYDAKVFAALEKCHTNFMQTDLHGNGAILSILDTLQRRINFSFPRVYRYDEAFEKRLAQIIQKLARKGVAMNDRRVEDGHTPLAIACACELPTVVSVLLKNGADPSVKGMEGKLPIELTKKRSPIRTLLTDAT